MDGNNTAIVTTRHKWPDRLFHWLMAVSTLILLLTSFLPIAGIQFDWVPWHWITGVLLTALVLFHIVRVLLVHGLSSMLPGTDDVREVLGDTVTVSQNSQLSPAKYDVYQKGYHWVTALVVLALVVTGLFMLIKLDTTFWNRNPGVLSDIQWGYVYVVHGAAALMLIFLVLLHVYFALLPEHKKLLMSMLTGRGPAYVRGEDHQ